MTPATVVSLFSESVYVIILMLSVLILPGLFVGFGQTRYCRAVYPRAAEQGQRDCQSRSAGLARNQRPPSHPTSDRCPGYRTQTRGR